MFLRYFSIPSQRLILIPAAVLLLNACEVIQKPRIEIKVPSEQVIVPKPAPKTAPEPITIPIPAPEEDLPVISEKHHYDIAALLPLSGPSADLGQQILQGTEIALYRYGKDHQNIRVYDTQGRRFTAIQAAKDAISDGADIVIGPLFSHSTAAVIPLVQDRDIPLISFSNNNALIETASPSTPVYILGVTPKEELRQLIEIGIFSGFENFALIAPDDDYGQQIHQDMQQLLSSSPARFARAMLYDPTSIDFSEPVQNISDYRARRIAYKDEVQRLKDSGIEDDKEIQRLLDYKETFGSMPFDAIILITYDDNSLRTLAAQLEYYEVEPETVQYMGLRQWQNFTNLHAEPSLRGSWFVGLDPRYTKQFDQLHQQIYQEPASFFAGLGFDAVAMLTHFESAGVDPMPLALQQRQGIQGATGTYRLEQDGTVSRKMSLFEITPRGVQVRLRAEDGWRN